ncbi:hypothetical protein F3Y22_tig00110773pilonHSYRG00032 [Hibiscus syriacus]|uniref:Uncharacterized protein n=1 Tax=Hibiscus syriacus TaxID=106335 RepID=A0A6A2ZS83_HIBSY|nr:hypothetical protein F3Y22_tig00110773pilonHSYRG00032 [Hibiscus syriacus]
MDDIQTYIILLLVWLVSYFGYNHLLQEEDHLSSPADPDGLTNHRPPPSSRTHTLQALHKLSTKYGPLMHIRLGSVPCVVASSPEMATKFLKTHDLFSNRPITASVDYLTYGSADFSFAPYGPYTLDVIILRSASATVSIKL